ncbi:DUF1015 domain-containing protein [Hymenobacter sp. H14-R3]|uniref:DUF1015 domain-containing protein n=1 Tax=Hymenobacter sp. H14-R3 TaxID=3046308 RepID=UPI0024BA1F10|nr:DUF1015 domain-containing protein [Hymenobacter sp. H14-R3]MDJ0365825.1 DUF1015 domain-containing protein [Hymenobacter sp. H14-R3]
MAEIQPVRGWRYNPALSAEIDEVVSPLFDVVSVRQREALYRNPLNSIHLSVPRAEGELSPTQAAARRLAQWQAAGVLRQDGLPGIYVYYQYFRLPGEGRERCRKGFMCHIRATDWADNVVLRHENTLPAAVSDRAELLAELQFQTSATHGLYRDEAFALEALMDEAIQDPLCQTEEDYQGARDVLAVIQDAGVIRRFQAVLASRQVILADGHHRYEGSLAYRQARQLAAGPAGSLGHEPWNFHLMYLTNAASDDVRILPTHRVLRELPGNLTDAGLLARLAAYFTVVPQAEAQDLPELMAGKRWAFGLVLPSGAYKLRLRPEVHAQLDWPTTPEVKDLDLTVLHYFVLEKVLGIVGPDAQRRWAGVAYVRGLAECLQQVDRGEARAAFLTNEVTMAQVEAVCHSGAVMPAKSTFFYPKTLAGLLFASLAEEPTVFGAVFEG